MTSNQKKYLTYAVIALIGYGIAKSSFTDLLSGNFSIGSFGGSEYIVQSVSHGSVQVVNAATGIPSEIYDESLVKKCLAGEIKRGSIIHR